AGARRQARGRGREDHLQLLRGPVAGAARGHGPYFEPGRRPAVRVVLLPDLSLMDLNAARELFETSQDLTVGIEEEWAIIDPQTLELVPKYEALRADADHDDVLAVAVSGELISSEIEIRSGRGEDVQHALSLQREARRRLFA